MCEGWKGERLYAGALKGRERRDRGDKCEKQKKERWADNSLLNTRTVTSLIRRWRPFRTPTSHSLRPLPFRATCRLDLRPASPFSVSPSSRPP